MTRPTDSAPTPTRPLRRTWWLAGRSVPAVVATVVGYCSFSSAMIGMSVRNLQRGGPLAGFSIFFIWALVSMIALFLISAVTSMVALRRHPELVRRPTNPMPPERARWWWILGSALALTAVVGLIVVVTGGGGGLWWVPFLAGVTGQWVFLMLARRTGQRAPVATNPPPSTT